MTTLPLGGAVTKVKRDISHCVLIGGSSLSNVRSSPSNCQIEKSLLKVFFGLILVFLLSYGHNGQD